MSLACLALEALPAPPAAAPAHGARSAAPRDSAAAFVPHWPEGSDTLHFENLDGVILVTARFHGAARDTAGLVVLDTGAGYLALDRPVAIALGVTDSSDSRDDVALASGALARLEIGPLSIDRVSPILAVDAGVVRNVTDRPVLGLLGQSLFRQAAIDIDYVEQRLTIVPLPPATSEARGARGAAGEDSTTANDGADIAGRIAASRAALAGGLEAGAIPVAFELVGDGKIRVRARVSDPKPPRWSARLDLLLDTGATKTVLFEPQLTAGAPRRGEWHSLRGLSAPTLFGSADATIARVPAFELETGAGAALARSQCDVAVLHSELGGLLSRATGISVTGLLGYSFLKNYRVTIDYPHRVAWLTPEPANWDGREYEYSHVGVQLERRDGAVRVVGVAAKSPAAAAGITVGDELVAIDGTQVTTLDIVEVGRRLEGEPGSAVDLIFRRGIRAQHYRLVRRQLL